MRLQEGLQLWMKTEPSERPEQLMRFRYFVSTQGSEPFHSFEYEPEELAEALEAGGITLRTSNYEDPAEARQEARRIQVRDLERWYNAKQRAKFLTKYDGTPLSIATPVPGLGGQEGSAEVLDMLEYLADIVRFSPELHLNIVDDDGVAPQISAALHIGRAQRAQALRRLQHRREFPSYR